MDTETGFYCLPFFVQNNFTIVTGAAVGSTSHHPVVNTTTGGQHIQFEVNFGNLTTIRSITYNNATIPLVSIPCANPTKTNALNGNFHVVCTLTGGT